MKTLIWLIVLALPFFVSAETVTLQWDQYTESGATGLRLERSIIPTPAVPEYQGCFYDSQRRALPSLITFERITITQCVTAARAIGKRYSGSQAAGECWAGDALLYDKRLEEECNMPCTAQPSTICGGSWRNSIYEAIAPQPSGQTWRAITTLAVTATAAVDSTATPGKTYQYRLVALATTPAKNSLPSNIAQVTVPLPAMTGIKMMVAP